MTTGTSADLNLFAEVQWSLSYSLRVRYYSGHELLVQAVFTLEFGAKVRPAWRNVRECLKSEPGYVYCAFASCITAPHSCRYCYRRQEPTQPYLCVKDPDLYLNPARMTYKR